MFQVTITLPILMAQIRTTGLVAARRAPELDKAFMLGGYVGMFLRNSEYGCEYTAFCSHASLKKQNLRLHLRSSATDMEQRPPFV